VKDHDSPLNRKVHKVKEELKERRKKKEKEKGCIYVAMRQ